MPARSFRRFARQAVLVFGLAALCPNAHAQTEPTPRIDPQNVTIIRDKYGVPHIYGKTDEDVAYGIAWAHAEDDYATIEQMLAISTFNGGRLMGPSGAIFDFFYGMLRIPEMVDKYMTRDLSPKVLNIMAAYCQGINEYAQTHPEDVKMKSLYPVTVKDMVAGFTLTANMFTGMPFAVQHLLEGRLDEWTEGFFVGGSNAIAANSNKTADDKTYLAVNSHQPLEGLFSWYEVHVHSDEGWNMIGGLFPGACFVFHGTKPQMGWACTFNWPDLVDYYKLELNPKNKKQYLFDGKYLDLEPNHVKLKVKVAGLTIPVKKKAYMSVYGPVLQTQYGTYAFRPPAMFTCGAAEMVYQQNKAKDINEFKKSFDLQAFPCMNYIYADAQDNLLYFSNQTIPNRDPSFAWRKAVVGNTSKTLWEGRDLLPPSTCPQVLNPKSGYIFNTNNTPFNATGPQDNLKPSQFPEIMGLQKYDNNRAVRLTQLFLSQDQITLDDFKRYKYDRRFPDTSAFVNSLKFIYDIDPAKYPAIAPALRCFQAWDRNGQPESVGAAVAILAFEQMFKEVHGGTKQLEEGLPATEAMVVRAFEHAQKYLMKHFGRVDVPLGEFQVHQKGNVTLPLGGLPDAVAAVHATPYKGGKGKYRVVVGDSYIQIAVFEKGKGVVSLETVNAYGSSNRPNSPHYTDQMEMFAAQKLKPMTFDDAAIKANAQRIYSPQPVLKKGTKK